eukprot:CCRYP_015782-RA/>CCRYP_015782-RA protein AED:0.11 eAED:0.11 QI:658/1/1/1/0.5/0.2/5/1652/486
MPQHMIPKMPALRKATTKSQIRSKLPSHRMCALMFVILAISLISRPNMPSFEVKSTLELRDPAKSNDSYAYESMPSPKMKRYNNIHDVPSMKSSGPVKVNGIGGLMEFNDVCLTKHISGSELEGVIHFIPDHNDVIDNKERCKHRSSPLNHHDMFAVNVSDYSYCMDQLKLSEYQHIPSHVETVHLYEEPVISLNFNLNIGHSLFDYLLIYLPHWHIYREQENFPFGGVISHVMNDCLLDTNTFWFCEILRTINAFGEKAQQLQPEPNNTTLYCYKSLYRIHIAMWQRMYTKFLTERVFDDFRDLLNQKFNLDRKRDYFSIQTSRNEIKRLLLYSHAPSGRRVWLDMNDKVEKYKHHPKYEEKVDFHIVDDFGSFSAAEQASLFNSADAIMMSHGAQMANSIFAVDGVLFVEMGCQVPVFLGEPAYMALLRGQYRNVTKCESENHDLMCLVCEGDTNYDDYNNFTMTDVGFQTMLDYVIAELTQMQ